ncbi:DUF6478 family protein [Frigidibacter sp. MR17.24]|uniref:DUF6478 family protein n=1 Tax=Frigidibacter sp. MR17.24 TaxID=3127345 RepID=UPI003012F92A
MPDRPDSFLDRFALNRSQQYWTRRAEAVGDLAPEDLRALNDRAGALRRQLERVMHQATGRLALPAAGAPVEAPLGTDWTWRPELWCGPVWPAGVAGVAPRGRLGAELTVFHDCPAHEISLRQLRNGRAEHGAAYGLQVEVLHFEGTFLSLALDLPEAAVQGLQLRHLMRLSVVAEAERPMEIYARLNVRHGPNTEQIVLGLPAQGGGTVEFDLAYTKMNERRVDRAWLDLIFDGPACNAVAIRDLTLGRRPRSDF